MNFWQNVLATVLASGLICGIIIYYIKRYINKKLEEAEVIAKQKQDARTKRFVATEKWEHALGRTLFWMNRFVETGNHNGELKAAYASFEEAEKEKKEIEQTIVAIYVQD